MRVGDRELILCDCEGSMALDAAALARALGGGRPELATQLCRRQQARLEGRDLLVACAQEREVFEEVLAERSGEAAADRLATTDIRARAAWSKEGAEATPKIAALIAEAALAIPETCRSRS